MSIANILKKNNYSIYCNDIDIDDQLIFKGDPGNVGDIIVKDSNNEPVWLTPPSGLKGDKGDPGSKGDKGDSGQSSYSIPAAARVSVAQNIGSDFDYVQVDFSQSVLINTDIIIQSTISEFEVQVSGKYIVHCELQLDQDGPVPGQLNINFFIDGTAYFSTDYLTANIDGSAFIASPIMDLSAGTVFTVGSKGFGLLQPIFTVPETSFISFTLINI